MLQGRAAVSQDLVVQTRGLPGLYAGMLRQQLRLAANGLVERGRDPATITSLCDLAEAEAFKEIGARVCANA